MSAPLFARLRGDERGITVVEFALVAPVLLLMLMGFFDLGHRAYSQAMLQGSLQKAARDSTLESGLTSTTAIDNEVKAQVKHLVGSAATFTSKRLSYTNFSQVGDPEVFKDKAPLNNKYDAGECFEDLNGNGKWDSDLGKSGQGGARDAVLYRMTVNYPRLLPMATMLGWSANQTISATTVLRNQPYGDQSIPVVTKCT